MEINYPSYYKSFQCIAGACPDSCCKEWEVLVDDASAERYRSLEGDLGDALRRVLKDTDDGVMMTIQDRRCPMWRADGLCRIQAELGHDALCKTCREFPRLRHDYGDFVELGLELSCPEAAKWILAGFPEQVSEEVSGGEAADYDTEAMHILLRSREVVLSYLRSAQSPIPLRLATVLLFAHHTQSWLDGGEEAYPDEVAAQDLLQRLEASGDWEALVSFFGELEILTDRWAQRLRQPQGSASWHDKQIPLLAYFIGRHWLQAVSDYDLIGRVKFMIAACLLLHHLGGDFLQTAQLFSKEIENDQDNLDAIFDGAYTSPALTDMNLLCLLKTSAV